MRGRKRIAKKFWTHHETLHPALRRRLCRALRRLVNESQEIADLLRHLGLALAELKRPKEEQ